MSRICHSSSGDSVQPYNYKPGWYLATIWYVIIAGQSLAYWYFLLSISGSSYNFNSLLPFSGNWKSLHSIYFCTRFEKKGNSLLTRYWVHFKLQGFNNVGVIKLVYRVQVIGWALSRSCFRRVYNHDILYEDTSG